MRYCLHLIRSMVSTGDEAVLQDFTDQGAINQIISKSQCAQIEQYMTLLCDMFSCVLAILTKIIAHRKVTESAVDIEMQCDMLFILSALCESDVHRKVWLKPNTTQL